MRKVLITAAVALLAFAALPAVRAVAGECMDGFQCDHVCPLAREASNHRSAGTEAVAAAPSVRAVLAASVERNMRRI